MGLMRIVWPLVIATAAGALPREAIDLSGTWQSARVSDLETPPAGDWAEVTVPGVLNGYDYGAAWFRRSVDVPAAWRGRHVLIRFGGVRWNSRVLVNGTPVGGCYNGYDAFELDVTAAVRFGEVNEILVGAHDWTGVFDPAAERVEWTNQAQVREQPTDRVLSPVGGLISQFGIWDRCSLVAVSPVCAASVRIVTSVRRGVIEVGIDIDGPRDGPVPVRATVLDADGAVALELPEVTTADDAVSLTAAWPQPRYWSHEDPYLYTLRLAVGEDEQRIPFGFRELWCDGGGFFLNGAKIHLLATSWWPPTPPYSDERVRETLLAIKRANTHIFRTHTQPWPENWYTVADEVGVLMIPEGAVWNDDGIYRLDDPRWWDNYRAHLLNMVEHLGNHASVVMWSLENELTGARLNDNTPARAAALAALADDVRGLDPTRPVTYESDGDPGGRADVIGMHYPNEWPRVYQWPQAGDWLPGPAPNAAGGGGFLWDDGPFVWRREKPLYIGEFLWVPSNNPDWSTVWLGDAAYRGYQRARTEAKALSWAMQIRSYRRAELSGMSPWTVNEHGPLDETNPCWLAHRDAYRPIAAFAREYDTRFFAGDEVSRTLDLYNDTLSRRELTLRVAFEPGPSRQLELGSLEPGAHRVETVTLVAPAGAERLVVTLTGGRDEVFRDEFAVTVSEREPLAQPARPVGVYDPAATGLVERLAAAGLATVPVPGLDGDLPPILVVAEDALAPSDRPAGPVVIGEAAGSERLVGYVRGGGRLLILPQAQLPSALFGVAGSDRASTMTFAGVADHPVLAGLAADDLKFWRGDHLVGRHEPQRPTFGGAVPIIVSGSAAGVSHAPLLELRRGDGVALFCGLELLPKLDAEPAARRLAANLLRYLDTFTPERGETVVAAGAEARAELDAIGLRYEPGDFGGAVTVLVEPSEAALRQPRLRAWVEGGGRLLISHLRPERAAALEALGITGLGLAAAPAAVSRLESADSPLLGHLFREDLYWLGPAEAVVGWAARPRFADQAVAVAVPKVTTGAGTVYQAEALRVDGPVVQVNGDHVLLASHGTVTGEIEAAADGDYVVGVTGWGTPCEGVYPQIAVSLDGTRVGEVYLASRGPDSYGVAARLTVGRHTVELAFVNDRNSPTEDRNAFIDSLSVAPTAEPFGMTPLTSPAALLAKPVGDGLVVLDQVRWTAPGGNQAKARRYLASLLTALGADFASRAGTVIEGESMRPQPGLQYLGPAGDHMRFGQSGWAEVELDVRAAGRNRLTLVARGDPAAGGWPIATLLVNGAEVGAIEVDRPDWSEFATELELPAGAVTLRLDYRNDLYRPPADDRNLFVDKLVLERLGD